MPLDRWPAWSGALHARRRPWSCPYRRRLAPIFPRLACISLFSCPVATAFAVAVSSTGRGCAVSVFWLPPALCGRQRKPRRSGASVTVWFTPASVDVRGRNRRESGHRRSNVCCQGRSSRAGDMALTSACSHKQTQIPPQQQRQFGASRCRWREPCTASKPHLQTSVGTPIIPSNWGNRVLATLVTSEV